MSATDTAEAPKSREERITAQRRGLPDSPGVYLFRGKRRRGLYVGKAKSIRTARRRPLLEPLDARAGGCSARSHIESVVTHTEAEALLLEQNFIRHYRPRYQRPADRRQSYPYIASSLDEDFPACTSRARSTAAIAPTSAPTRTRNG